MQLETPRFGAIEIDPDTVLTFPRGLAGLPHLTRFKLLHEDRPSPIVHWLQSLDDTSISFNLVDPALLGIQYELVLTDEESKLLEARGADDLIVMLMVGPKSDGEQQLEARARLPFVLNPNSRRGLQKDNVYPVIVFKNIG